MNKLEYETIVQQWLELFPEFQCSQEIQKSELDLPYVVMADFARFLSKRLEKYGKNDEFVRRVFKVINEHYEQNNSDKKVSELIKIEIFENLVETEMGLKLGRKMLVKEAMNDFDIAYKYCGVHKNAS